MAILKKTLFFVLIFSAFTEIRTAPAEVIKTCVSIEYQRENGTWYTCNDARGDIIYYLENPDNLDAKRLAEKAQIEVNQFCGD